MSQTTPTRPSLLAASAGKACACVLACAAFAAGAAAQDRNPFDTSAASGGEVTVSEYLTVDLHVQNEDLANVLQMLSIQSERNIVMSSNVSATVTADLYNVTFYEALEAILNVNGYGYIERGNFLYVYTLEEIAQIERANRTPVSKVLTLDYLNANDAAEFVSPLLSEIGQIKNNGDVDLFNVPDNAPIGDEQFALAATIVVFDYPEHVEEIEKLIKQLDTRPSQVLVEATILQTALTEANAFGVDFSFLNDINFTDFITAGGPLGAANALIRGGMGGDGDGISPADNRAVAGTSTVGNTSGPGGFKVSVIQDDFSLFVRMLDEVTDTTIISNPKILAVNRAPARVLVGERVGFLNTTSTETSTTQTVDFLDTGTQLAFRPFISNNGYVRMELKPSVSEARIRDTTDATGATVTIPDEITQELTTNVIVRDGSTIVLGGLFKEETRVGRRQVPFVGNLPLIGAAFRGHNDATDRSEIIFLITPTIMNDDVLLSQGEAAMEEIQRVRTGSRTGLLPWSRDRMTAKLNLEAERLANEGEVEKALWKIRRSLSLNSQQPEVIELREKLLGKRELWPDRSLLNRVMDRELEGSRHGDAGTLGAPPKSATVASSDAPDEQQAVSDATATDIKDESRPVAQRSESTSQPQRDGGGDINGLELTVTMTPSQAQEARGELTPNDGDGSDAQHGGAFGHVSMLDLWLNGIELDDAEAQADAALDDEKTFAGDDEDFPRVALEDGGEQAMAPQLDHSAFIFPDGPVEMSLLMGDRALSQRSSLTISSGWSAIRDILFGSGELIMFDAGGALAGVETDQD